MLQLTVACGTGNLTISIDVIRATVRSARLESDGALAVDLGDATGKHYLVNMQLFAPVNVTEGWWQVLPRSVLLSIQKQAAGPYWKRLFQGTERHPRVSIDWSRWVDEREDGVRWNPLSDRQWEWWKPEKRTEEDLADEAYWGLSGERKAEL